MGWGGGGWGGGFRGSLSRQKKTGCNILITFAFIKDKTAVQNKKGRYNTHFPPTEQKKSEGRANVKSLGWRLNFQASFIMRRSTRGQ